MAHEDLNLPAELQYHIVQYVMQITYDTNSSKYVNNAYKLVRTSRYYFAPLREIITAHTASASEAYRATDDALIKYDDCNLPFSPDAFEDSPELDELRKQRQLAKLRMERVCEADRMLMGLRRIAPDWDQTVTRDGGTTEHSEAPAPARNAAVKACTVVKEGPRCLKLIF